MGKTHKNIIIIIFSIILLSIVVFGWMVIKNNSSTVPRQKIVQEKQDKFIVPIISSTSLISGGKDTFVKQMTVDCSDYKVVKTTDNYNLVIVKGLRLLFQDPKTPVLPTARISVVKLPLDAKVNSVNVNFTNPVDLRRLKIPAYNMGDPMGSGGYYVDCPANIGTFPTDKYSYRIARFENYKEVFITLIPAEFNSTTRQVKLYKTVTIVVNYSTPQKGILEGASTYGSTYSVGENIQTNVVVKNITSSSSNSTINVALKDIKGNVVASQMQTQSIDAGTTFTVPISIPAYNKGGTYTLDVTVTDDNGSNIGEWKNFINIVPFEIVSFTAPAKIVQGDYGTFNLTLRNLKNQSVLFYSNIYIYDGNSKLVAKLPRMNVTLNAGERKTISTQWYPSKYISGLYSAQLVVTSADNNYSISRRADVEVRASTTNM